MRQSWETMNSVSAGHIILTPTQPVGSGRPQRESNPVPPHQESYALPTELPRPPPQKKKKKKKKKTTKKTLHTKETLGYLLTVSVDTIPIKMCSQNICELKSNTFYCFSTVIGDRCKENVTWCERLCRLLYSCPRSPGESVHLHSA